MLKQIVTLCLCFLLLLTGCRAGPSPSNDRNEITSTTNSVPLFDTSSATTTASSSATFTTTEATVGQSTSTPRTDTTTATRIPTVSTTNSADAAGSTTFTASTTSTSTTQSTTVFTATIRNDRQELVSGVTVSVWGDGDILIGQAITDRKGVARIPFTNRSHRVFYVTLNNLPIGYKAEERYRFTTTEVNIIIRKAAVQNELDHSDAQYDVGLAMTDFSLTDTDGNRWQLSDLLKDKKLVILNFWFVNCEPCKSEFPFFEASVQRYQDEVALLAINPFDSVNSIRSLRNQFNKNPDTAITFPMLKDTCNLYLGFEVMAYPTTVFIDKTGNILAIHTGAYPSAEALLAEIEKHIK